MLNGETFTMYADVLHSQPLEQDLSIKLSDLQNLDCETANGTAEAGAIAGLETFSVDCEITKGQSVVSGVYQFIQADGSVIGEGIFGAAPGETTGPSTSATAEPGGISDTTDDENDKSTTNDDGNDQGDGNSQGDGDKQSGGSDDKSDEADTETSASTAPSGSTSDADSEAATAKIEIAKARFNPSSFVVRTGQEFAVEKDVTISEAPLHSALTMTIDRQQNLTCDPQSETIAEGAEGTKTLTFDCTITGADRAPGAWYSIVLDDGTVLVENAYFGLSEGGMSEGGGSGDSDSGDSDSGSGDGSESTSTRGGLANTGGPLLGFLAAGTALTVLGTKLARRRRESWLDF